MHRSIAYRAIACGLLLFTVAPTALGQSTISDRPFDLIYSGGPWGLVLPDYEMGTDTNGESGFRDDGDTLGAKWELKAIRRFLGTRTSFETKAYAAWAEANSAGSTLPITVPNPTTGAANALAAGASHLKNGTVHYGIDVALRDTWRTRFGGLSAGLAFSWMRFDQYFKLDVDRSRVLREDLDNKYLGGKGFVGWDGCLFGKRQKADLAFGYFDTDFDYSSEGSAQIPGSVANTTGV